MRLAILVAVWGLAAFIALIFALIANSTRVNRLILASTRRA